MARASSVAREPLECSEFSAFKYGSVKSGSVGQISEELPVLDEGQRIVPLLGGKALHCIGQLIDYFDRLTLLVYPFGVAGPTRNHGCRQASHRDQRQDSPG